MLAPNTSCPIHQLPIDCVFTHTHPLFRPCFLPAFIPAPQFPPTAVSCSLTSHQCVITVSCVISISHKLPSRLFPVDWPTFRQCITVYCVINISHTLAPLFHSLFCQLPSPLTLLSIPVSCSPTSHQFRHYTHIPFRPSFQSTRQLLVNASSLSIAS